MNLISSSDDYFEDSSVGSIAKVITDSNNPNILVWRFLNDV